MPEEVARPVQEPPEKAQALDSTMEEPDAKRQKIGQPSALDNEELRRRVLYVPANQPVLLRLPSSMTKQVVLEPGKTVSIGKFGSFPADQVIGRPFGPTYEILPDGTLEIMHQDVAEALGRLHAHDSGERSDE